MAYSAVFLACILVIALIPSAGGAQSIPVGLGLPSLGGVFGGRGCAPLCDPKTAGGVDFLVGYLETDRSLVTELSHQDQSLANLLSVRHAFPVHGLWVSLCAHGSINEQVGLFARGSWLFASGKQTDANYTGLVAGVLRPGGSKWTTRPQWYTIDGGGYFPVAPVSLIGGFRFDSFETKFNRSNDFFVVSGSPGDDADLTVTSYIPYVGLMARQGSAVKVGFIGFPYVPGSIKYRETFGAGRTEFFGGFRTSYFLEAFAEYGMNLLGGNVGIFGIWTYLHARSNVSANFDQVFSPGLWPGQTFDFTFYRQTWTFGGKFGINFTSPI